jgi:tRNA-specific 2-thiouridylase
MPPADPETPFECDVQIRAHADPVPAVAFVRPSTGSRTAAGSGATELVIRPVNPLNGVSPGQSAVLYVGTRVLGQCTIDRTVSAVPQLS